MRVGSGLPREIDAHVARARAVVAEVGVHVVRARHREPVHPALRLSRELDVVRVLEREAILGPVVLVVTLVDQGGGVDGRLHAVHVLGVVPIVGERDEPLYLTLRPARADLAIAGIEAAAGPAIDGDRPGVPLVRVLVRGRGRG